MSYDGRAVANFILDFADQIGKPLSNLELQKISFFCHAWHLVEFNEPLVKSEFEAWQHGPVLQYLYRQFKEFEAKPITGRATRIDPLTGRAVRVAYNFPSQTVEFLQKVVRFYTRMAPWDLVEISHVEEGPWHRVWHHEGKINPGMKISNASIEEFYSRIPQNERVH